jgi:AcrR family transcriptional regulator
MVDTTVTTGASPVNRRSTDKLGSVAEPAFTRLDVDERRRRLLELGAELFTRYSYDELSMARIAREAGISKALLYHYFPSKQAFFEATLAETAGELVARTAPDPALPPLARLEASLDAYLAWIEEHEESYRKLIDSATSTPEVRQLIDGIRSATARTILDGVGTDSARVRAAVNGWLWFMDGACLDWTAHDDVSRDALRGLLVGTLIGALASAGADLDALGSV